MSSSSSAAVNLEGELIPTSAALMESWKHIADACRAENAAFIGCKKKDPNLERCLDKGRQVTNCVLGFDKHTVSHKMGLWTLLEGLVLLANAFAILNEDRFLAPRGWGFSEVSTGGRTKTLKGQLMGLIYATQYLRVPLIIFNIIIIFVKLVSG